MLDAISALVLELTTLNFVDVHRAVVAALPRIVQCPEDAPETSQLFILKGYRIPFQNISTVLTGWRAVVRPQSG